MNHENYISNQILETADLNGKNIFDFICPYSQVILREIFGANILDFRDNRDQVKFAFTVQLRLYHVGLPLLLIAIKTKI